MLPDTESKKRARTFPFTALAGTQYKHRPTHLSPGEKCDVQQRDTKVTRSRVIL